MKNIFTLFLIFMGAGAFAQSSYSLSNYAVAGDSVFLTRAYFTDSTDFDTTGVNFNWDFSNLIGYSQYKQLFKQPNQTGFTIAQFPYIYNSSNVNLASGNGQTYYVGTMELNNVYEYTKKAGTTLEKKAQASTIVINNSSVTTKTTYTDGDVELVFPFTYNSVSNDVSSFSTSVQSYFYRGHWASRSNKVDGYGILQTPYGTFTDVLRMVTDLVQYDTISLNGTGVYADTVYSRDLKWFSPSKKFQVLTVHQTLVSGKYVTTGVEYLDSQQYFQPVAAFAYYPVNPMMGDTILFQNLTTNASSYSWNFGDLASGSSNTATNVNPQHVFDTAGVYPVTLIATNGSLSDTIIINVHVSDTADVIADFTFTPLDSCSGSHSLVFSNASSANANAFVWMFGDSTNGVLKNPTHLYLNYGTYKVKLIAYTTSGKTDTVEKIVVLHGLPVLGFTATQLCKGDSVYFNPVLSGYQVGYLSYLWSFGSAASPSVSTMDTSFSVYADTGSYLVSLQVSDSRACNNMIQKSIRVVECVPTANATLVEPSTELYPNPAVQQVWLSNAFTGKVVITDLSGKVVKVLNLQTEDSFSISDLTNGVYLVKLMNAEFCKFERLIIKD